MPPHSWFASPLRQAWEKVTSRHPHTPTATLRPIMVKRLPEQAGPGWEQRRPERVRRSFQKVTATARPVGWAVWMEPGNKLHLFRILVDTWMLKAILRRLTWKRGVCFGNWLTVTRNLAGLCSRVEWKVELASDELRYLAEEISKPSEGVAWFT